MKEFIIEERVDMAIQNYESGFNCAQSVFLAYCDVFELDILIANRITGSFGDGIGRMKDICGAVMAMAMLASLKYPATDPSDQSVSLQKEETVQQMTNIFKENHGTILCRELLQSIPQKELPKSLLRPIDSYKKRPCIRLVEEAAYISGKMILNEPL